MNSVTGMRLALVTAALAPLAACSGLQSKEPVDQLYVLRPAPATAAPSASTPGLLVLRRPEVQPGLDTARIALVLPGNRLDYYAASRWSASLSRVVDAFATQSLQSSGRFELVNGGDRGSGGARYLLVLTVRHFEADYAGGERAPPAVHVALECLLVSSAGRAPLGRCDGEATVPATENRMEAIVQAFEAAARQAMGEVTEQVSRLAAAAPPPASR